MHFVNTYSKAMHYKSLNTHTILVTMYLSAKQKCFRVICSPFGHLRVKFRGIGQKREGWRGGGRLEGGEVAGGREGGMWQVERTEGHRNWVDAFRWTLHRFYIPSLCCRRVLYI